MKKFFGRLVIRGYIEVITGLHIGVGGSAGIGLVDNATIKDPLTGRPMVPGSSLKGRLRHALCDLQGEDSVEVVRLFGSAPKNEDEGSVTRLYVRDSILEEESAKTLEETTTGFVEVKYENVIDRATGKADNPRQTERLPAHSKLTLELVYNVLDEKEAEEDLQNIHAALRFVEHEYLGGSGSRGYGKVEFDVNELEWISRDDYLNNHSSRRNPVGSASWLPEAIKLLNLSSKVGA